MDGVTQERAEARSGVTSSPKVARKGRGAPLRALWRGVVRPDVLVPRLSGRAVTGRRLTAYDVMDAREVAELLRVPKSTVEDWGRRGIIPSCKVGRRRLYLREKIEALLRDGGEPE